MNHSAATLSASLTAKRLPLERVPVIDAAGLYSDDIAARRSVATALHQACRDIGFFYVVNHGLEPALMARTFERSHEFFSLPLEKKNEIAFHKSAHNRGYVAIGVEKLDPTKKTDLKEALNFGREVQPGDPEFGQPLRGPNQWPADMPDWCADIRHFRSRVDDFAQRLARAFALSLELPEEWFADKIDRPIATLRFLHYPPQGGAIAEEQIGAGAHTDYGIFTVLFQDEVGGLQVRNVAGEWIDAPPLAGAAVINVGDLMMRWTNDLYLSTPHRVINASGRERYSIAYFFDPNYDAPIETIPTCIPAGEAARYEPTTGGGFIEAKLNATYAKKIGSQAGKEG
ncbi:isopenicillin N synthase family dioxygenase [Radicibacter daui]|uniref:isopenicillin N synthase family dioxygenase n=1 Tax=Radicibacter daui TaxID=3064829 RepID=UPI004046D3EE